ncbi:MAG: hypothetical protein JXA18_12930 [Chitinispirillaceae bacterium]|nr:hypothetical protein [Chitinispirillaceae bacterium]
MNKPTIAISTLLFSSVLAASGVPVEDMSPFTLGIEYQGMIAGQTITRASVHSLFRPHYLTVRYAPLPYLLVSAGAGSAKFSIAEYDSTRFDGNRGISAAIGLHGFTPRLIDFLMITAGTHGYLLNSTQDDYRYIAAVADPVAGVRCLIGDMLDIEAGAKGHIIYGRMNGPAVTDPLTFSNNNRIRGYLSMTLHSFSGGAYMSLSMDLSPYAEPDWSDGPYEASLSLRIGALIRTRRSDAITDAKEKKVDYFRNYDKMKEQQEKMADEMRKRR